jgi:hypothetical protein
MATAALNFVTSFEPNLNNGQHDFDADTFKFALTSVLPTVGMTQFSSGVSTPPSPANGYTTNGHTASISDTGGVVSLGADVVITATAGGIGSFRYVILYNSSSTTPTNAVIGWYDYGSSIPLAVGETFTIAAGTVLTTTAT